MSRRTEKVAEAVREQVSTSILFELKDPRVKNVTVTRVEASPDLRSAKVYVSIMGDEKAQRLSMRGLESARGFLQAMIAERVQIRYTPILQFQLDQGVKRSIEAARLLREVLPKSEAESDPDTVSELDPESDPDWDRESSPDSASESASPQLSSSDHDAEADREAADGVPPSEAAASVLRMPAPDKAGPVEATPPL